MDFYSKHPILCTILLGGGTYLAYHWLTSTDAPPLEFELQYGDTNWAYVKHEGEIVGQVYFMDAGAWIATGDDPDIESPPFATQEQALDWLRKYYADRS